MIAQVQALLEFLAVNYELSILDFIQEYLANPFMDKAMPIVTLFGEKGIFVIVVAVVLIIIPRTRKAGWSMGVAMLLGLIFCNGMLKPIVARIRPYDLYEQLTGEKIKLLISAQKDFSFPSGHTIAMFEACTALMIKNKWAGIPATILAFLVAFSRMYLYVHYPTDVLFSVFAGIFFGFVGTGIVSLVYRFLPKKALHKGKYEA